MNSGNLENLLTALREEDRGIEAPRHVEAALRSAFRAQASLPVRRGWERWALAAAAAVAVVCIGAAGWKLGQPVPVLPPLKVAIAPPAALPIPAPVLVAAPLVAKHAKRPHRAPVTPVAKPEPPAREIATDFMPIEDTMSLAPIESGQVLRVALPRSTMVRFGFPVNQDRMLEPVKADVVFAQDGIARAIRFVK